jgi:DNA-directed RNA polymerase specialized sigma24 family protein
VRAEEAVRASQGCSGSQSREEKWATWMRAAMSGDAGAYREFLESVALVVRLLVRRAGGDVGLSMNQVEEEVQEILLAIHIKRGTWDKSTPVGPWIVSIMLRARRIRSRLDVTFQGPAAVLWETDQRGASDFVENTTGPADNASWLVVSSRPRLLSAWRHNRD